MSFFLGRCFSRSTLLSFTSNAVNIFYSSSNRPAALNSFVVVNFAHNNHSSCAEYVRTMLTVALHHGIEIPHVTMEVARNYLENVTVLYSGSNPVDDVSL